MKTREIAEEYRLSHWAQIMKARAESGQSVRAFCREAGYGEHVYYYWQRKLREAACQELLPTTAERSNLRVQPGWVACVREDKSAQHGGLLIEIGSFRVRADASVDMSALEKVCRVLATIC